MLFDFYIQASKEKQEIVAMVLTSLGLSRYKVEHNSGYGLAGYGVAMETVDQALDPEGPLSRFMTELRQEGLGGYFLIGDPNQGVQHLFYLTGGKIQSVNPDTLGVHWENFWELKRTDPDTYYARGLEAVFQLLNKQLTAPKEEKTPDVPKKTPGKGKEEKKPANNKGNEKVSFKAMALGFLTSLVLSFVLYLLMKKGFNGEYTQGFLNFLAAVVAFIVLFLLVFLSASLLYSKFLDKGPALEES